MRKNNFKNYLSIVLFLFAAIFFYGCSGGGGGSVSESLIDSRPKIPVSLNLMAAPGAAAIPLTAVGSVEITVYRGSISDPNKVVFNITRVEFASRRAEIGVFAGDTYSIVLNAKAKNDPLADTEFVYKATVDSFFVPLETSSGGGYATPLAMNLNQTAQIKLYPARIGFEPLEKRTVKYGDVFGKITVAVYDQFGRIFEGAKDAMILSADPLDNTTVTPVVSGQVSVTPANGIAVFTNISLSSESARTGVTRFAASIGASASSASSVVTKSEDILIYNQSNKPVISSMAFQKQPLPLAGVGRAWDSFTVALLDQYGNVVDTDETVTLSASAGALAGTLSVKAQNGVASFTGITAAQPASVNLKAAVPGFSAFSDNVKIISGAVSKTRVFVTNQTYMYCYDFYHGDDSSKLAVRAVLASTIYLGAIKTVKPSFNKEKLYILDDNNYFTVFTGLAAESPSSNVFNLGAFNTEKLIDFAPSIDNLSIYLVSSKSVYKWHIVNEPNFVIANTQNISFTNTASAAEIKNNKLYLTGDIVIAPYDFSVYPPRAENQIPLYDRPSGITLSGDKKYAATAEVRGKNIYLINAETEKFERIPLGQPEPTGGAYLKFSSYADSLKLYLAKFSDGNIYSYNVAGGAGSVIVADSYASMKPIAIDTDKTGRLVFTLNGSGSAFVRIFDAKTDSFVEDIMLNGGNGQNISYYEDVNAMVAY
ncbi:MAG TPA: Ig-like domain-containing protein [Candidatus Wallbacteria bacterium]|nr:Ig-like domain-containing protein [Candidatus Wallbacteria bacterium]